MTYLELVNGTLRRLREDSVSTVVETTYSTMVSDYINDAKRIVEGAWDWSSNRSIITVTTAASTTTYSLTGFGQDGKVLTAFNDTQNGQLRQYAQAWFDKTAYVGNAASGSVDKFCFRGVDSNNDSIVEVHPTPSGVESLKFSVSTYQADLSADSDVLNIPHNPVLHLAIAMLAEEKGEAIGLSSARYFEIADKHLGDAIAFDAAKNPFETVWYTP